MGFFEGLFVTDVRYDNIKEEYTIVGMTGFKNLLSRYGEKNINNIFTSLGRTEMVFPSIFLYEVIEMFKDAVKRPTYGINVKALNKIIGILETRAEENRVHDIDNKLDFDMIKAKMFHTPFEYQQELFNHYEDYKYRTGYRGLTIGAAAGTGKALRNGTPVRTLNGWTPIEQIKVGDIVLAPDGFYTAVEGVYPQGLRQLYRVTFIDGRTIDCDEEHLWEVYSYNFSKHRNRAKKKLTPKVITTLELEKLIANKAILSTSKFKNYYIRLTEAEATVDVDLPIPPYTLGTILGSYATRNTVKIVALEKSVLQRVRDDLGENYHIEIRGYEGCTTGIVTPAGTFDNRVPSLTKLLTDLKLLNIAPKYLFIPEIYLNASRDQKLELLRGIMDTCGYSNRMGNFNAYHTSQRLINDLATLIYSLGGIATKRIPQIRYRSLEDRSYGERCYRLSIKLKDPSEVMTRYTRGTENIEESEPDPDMKLLITDVEKIDVDAATCIKVDHPSHLYVTKDYLVTHNTNISLTFGEMLHSEKVLIICPLPTLEKVWLKSIQIPGKDNLFKDPSKNKVWSIKSSSIYNNEKFIIVHYEGLEQLYGILPKIAGPKLTIIVDESHNFADTKSKRTILLQDIIDRSFTKNLFLLSGTPIKSYSTEIINMAKFIDGRLKGKLYDRLYSVYSNPNKFFKSILPGRYNEMTYVVEKKETNLEPVIKTYIPITLKNGNEYTLPVIREKMREFITRRLEEIEKSMPDIIKLYETCLTIAAQNDFDKKSKYSIAQYRNLVITIQEAYRKRQLGFIAKEMALANAIEREIKSFLPPELGKQWDDIKTIIKYPMLKIQGECLGKIVMGARIKCHVDIALNLDYEALTNSTIKDTIIFSNYIQVCEAARSVLTNLKYNMALVYGEYAKNLNKEVKRFTEDKNVNPLVTTYKSLSTGVPLTNANVIVALDLPFRMYIFEQAISRAWRVGQDSQVVVYIPSLDTGNTPNINQRNLDIISFFNAEVEALTGYKSAIDVKETEAMNLESINQLVNFDMYLKDYDTLGYKHKVLNW